MIEVPNKRALFLRKVLPLLAIFLGGVAFIFITINAVYQTGLALRIDFGEASSYGGLLAGMFSFLSALLLYFNFRHNTDTSEKSAFESRFFQMIKYHRENANECIYLAPDSKKKVRYTGKRVFIKIHSEIETLIDEIRAYFENSSVSSIYKSESELLLDKENGLIRGRGIDIKELNLFCIAYYIVFFGVSKLGLAILRKLLSRKYRKEFYEPILKDCAAKPVRYSEYYESWQSDRSGWTMKYFKKNQEHPKYVKFYGGHQIRLGHYFRHLFQAVNYVNRVSLSGFNYKNRYEYIKLLRAQLSTYEQAVFFFNSLSIGRIWEINKDPENYNEQLITKYNLIGNIPSEFISSVDLSKYYPDVTYEEMEATKNRHKIEKCYK